MLTKRQLHHGRRRSAASPARWVRVSAAKCAERIGTLLRDERGGAAIEFALVTPPFVLLMVGMLEVSIMFFTGSVIEGATKEAARAIRTGQVQESTEPLVTFQTEVCDALYNVIDCSQLILNVQTYASFGDVAMTIDVDEDGEIINTGFVPGGSSAVTVVRAMYRWNFTTPLMDELIATSPAGNLLVSTVAFQNEPYSVD